MQEIRFTKCRKFALWKCKENRGIASRLNRSGRITIFEKQDWTTTATDERVKACFVTQKRQSPDTYITKDLHFSGGQRGVAWVMNTEAPNANILDISLTTGIF